VDPVGERPESVGRRWTTGMLSTGCPHSPQGEGRSEGLVHKSTWFFLNNQLMGCTTAQNITREWSFTH